MLKNKNQVLPLDRTTKVYLEYNALDANQELLLDKAAAKFTEQFHIVPSTSEADCAVIFINEPHKKADTRVKKKAFGTYDKGYDVKDREEGGNGYVPISLQYEPYTARNARKSSIGKYDSMDQCDRSYFGKTVQNDMTDIKMLEELRRKMEKNQLLLY